MKRLILMGAGHSHMLVLKQYLKSPLRDVEVIVVTPSRWQYYSGMIPGWIAGHYAIDQCRIDVEPVVKAVGASLILDNVVDVLSDQKQVRLAGGALLDYDFLSIDIGAKTNLTSLSGYIGPVISIKPLGHFHQQWLKVKAASHSGKQHLAIIGGGAAGAELAMAMAYAGPFQADAGYSISLITGTHGLLPDFGARLRKLTQRKLEALGVNVLEQRATGTGDSLSLTDGSLMRADLVIAVTGAEPFSFLSASGLVTDNRGFVLVNKYHQSLSHPDVFAAGDVCSRQDQLLSRSGVHAVRAAPALAANLRAAIEGGEFTAFQPRANTLYLIACGEKTAAGSYGPFTFSGKWVWRLKDKIDRGFVRGFTGR